MPEKKVLKLLVFGQAFLLFSLLLMPCLIQWLTTPLGMAVYVVLAIGSVAQGVALHHVLQRLE